MSMKNTKKIKMKHKRICIHWDVDCAECLKWIVIGLLLIAA